jgi:hypothetical protein
MSEPKPFASLSASLLARKGQARPAMRPQSFNAPDDLGWNDMGPGVPAATTAIPAVVRQQHEIAQEFAAPAEQPAPPEGAPASAPLPPTTGGAKAAFTLRLDSERHLKLRIACAMRNRSAQSVVIEALDAFLNSLPGIDAVAESFPAPAPHRARTKQGIEE